MILYTKKYQTGKKLDIKPVNATSRQDAENRFEKEKARKNAADLANLEFYTKQGMTKDAALKHIKSMEKGQGELKEHVPQNSVMKGIDIATNPMHALKYKMKYGSVPDNFTEDDEPFYSPVSVIDEAISDLTGAALLKKVLQAKSIIKPLKKFKQELIYKGIDPVGYGAKEKAKQFIPNLIDYTITPDNKIKNVTKGLQSTDIRVGQNRLDAWRNGLGLEQNYGTFSKGKNGALKINSMSPKNGRFSVLYNDIKASQIDPEDTDALLDLARSHKKAIDIKVDSKYGEFSINDFVNYLRKKPDPSTIPWKQTRLVEKSKNPDFDFSVYDYDQDGVMGSFRWDVKKLDDGNLHFQSNDTWDLNPWESRGKIYITHDEKKLNQHFKKKLQKVEVLKLLGGKPYNIQNNFIVDPKDYSILKSFSTGGKLTYKK